MLREGTVRLKWAIRNYFFTLVGKSSWKPCQYLQVLSPILLLTHLQSGFHVQHLMETALVKHTGVFRVAKLRVSSKSIVQNLPAASDRCFLNILSSPGLQESTPEFPPPLAGCSWEPNISFAVFPPPLPFNCGMSQRRLLDLALYLNSLPLPL